MLVLGVLCLAYYAVLCVTLKKWDSTFSRFWLAAGVLLLLCNRISGIPVAEAWKPVLETFVLILEAVFIVTEGMIITGIFPDKGEEYPYLIVLGAQVNGREITDSLYRRLRKAAGYLKEHPHTLVIVSGGMGKGEEITEAAAMADYLLAEGIEKSRIILEDRSRTTKENLKYSSAYMKDMGMDVGIVSNNFHIYRACRYAKRLGYQHPHPVAAGCHPLLLVNYMIREFFAVWKMYLLG